MTDGQASPQTPCMRMLLWLVLLPSLLAALLFGVLDGLASKLGALKWVFRVALLPLVVLALPAMWMARPPGGDEDDGREHLFPSIPRRCLDKGFPLEAGVRWGGMRVHLYAADAKLQVFYLAECDGRVLHAHFEGAYDEEKHADALFASLKRVTTGTETATPQPVT
jgi:hypothetical protein